ncbi:MAG: acyl-CoA dehydrogenase family protein [Thermodesulfobacteriota bacterium]
MSSAAAVGSPLAAARSLAGAIAAAADGIESARRVPPALAGELARAGLFRMLVPRELGGLEVEPLVMVDAIELVARADGSTGWTVAIGATTGLVAAYLPDAAAHEVFARDPDVVAGGVFHPRGRAELVDGGYRVTGRWPLASGCQQCGWLVGGCLLFADGKPRLRDDGLPEPRMMLFPASEARIVDTWHVSGLRGTGSHDVEVEGLFVPRERSVWFSTDAPRRGGPLYAFPVFGLLALGIAAVALGIARGAIDDLTALATAKVPTGSRRRLAERGATQAEIGRAEATLGAARAYVRETVREVWDAVRGGEPMRLEQRARLRLAATQAVRDAAGVVDAMYDAGGVSSIYASSTLQRRFRDVHVATQHVLVAPPTFELAGRVLLGLPCDTEML